MLATLGAHGAVLVTADGAWHASPPPDDVVSTVGAGDSSLFGYLLGRPPRTDRRPPTRARRRLRQRRRRTARHDHPPPLDRSRPSWSRCATSTSPKEGEQPCQTSSPRASSVSTRPGHRQGRRHPGLADVVAAAGRAERRRPPHRRRAGPRGHLSDRASPAGSRSPTAAPPASTEPTLAFARLAPSVDFGAKDGRADLAFLIAAPEGGDATHLTLLTKLARALVKPAFTDGAARRRHAAAEVVELVLTEIGATVPAAEPAHAGAGSTAAAAPEPATAPGVRRSLVAVTACPTGIAHTYMAAEALEAAAERAGVDIAVETQGSAGSTPLPRDTIAQAAAVIFAVDVGVRDRQPVRRQARRLLGREAADRGGRRDDRGGPAVRRRPARAPGRGHRRCGRVPSRAAASRWGARARRVLMTGVSYMIPFVAAGGLLIALSFLLGGYEIVGPVRRHRRQAHALRPARPRGLRARARTLRLGAVAYLGALFFILGKTAFELLVPAFAGYIAYAIADRPGHRARLRHGRPRGRPVRRADSGHPGRPASSADHRRRAGRRDRPLDRPLEGPGLGARPDARPGDPAADLHARRAGHDRGPRQADQLAHGAAQRGPEHHVRQQRRSSSASCSA